MTRSIVRRGIIGATLIAGFCIVTSAALAEPPVSMAPPLGIATGVAPEPPANDGTSSVYNFKSVPENQQVPLNRAVFDQNGYQLFGRVGETIVVPFINQNLYVMKFAPSPDNSLYFINANGTPTLYVPRNGYLDNTTEPGAKWYPFSKSFQPETPDLSGTAPSYSQFLNPDWYPDAILSGGYYGIRPFSSGGFFGTSPGLTLHLGGSPYYSRYDYRPNVFLNPYPYRFGYFNQPTYNILPRPRVGQPAHDSVGDHGDHGFPKHEHDFANGGHPFHGASPRFSNNHGVRESTPRFTGKPNFIRNRDRAPGPVFGRPTGGSESKSGFKGGVRADNDRRGGNRAPGGTRSGGRYSGDNARGRRGG
ncbi:MAG: hypothetical protein H8F28_17685 [Fibrella sp.]|nr:hypothetical protein [Armatimonadota bacterium]